ncbi:Kelch like family member 7 [Crotalus adamanteus]|uniref:Kelch like family member 7 n=1 Tax=Crotalus adamanteus TaxID=8729 RepID=A0AAW1B4F5_CROAD
MAASVPDKSCKKKTEKKLAAREEAKLLASFMGVMNNMRKQKTLCDVILIVQERRIPAHRVVLASASHFFNLMFTTNMIESKSFEVELKDAEPDIIEQLVEFAYTARISVNSNNVQSLLDAANQYQIEPVKKMCVEFLKEQVDATNCLGISVLAECLDCPELKATADDYIHQHFTEVYKTDEFQQLDVKRVTHLLNQDTLTVRAEDQVYDAAVRWLKYDEPNRQPYMVDILAKVRFPLISKNFLSKTVQAEPLIQDNPECLKMVISGMRYHLLSPEDREELVDGTRPRRKKHEYRIALFGGSQPQSCRYFNPKDYSWTDIRCPFEKRRDAACVFWDNVVYILGGSQLFPIKRMDCYNVVKDSWYSKLGPPTPRDSLAACAAEGKIYTSGGSEVGNSALYLFECYDTRTESWHTKPNMLTQRCSHGMVEANGLIYVCGGSLGNNVSGRVLGSCEVYDPAKETWTELCPMLEARKNHGLVVVKDKIFAVGGQNSLGGLDSVEYYDIKLNEWKMVSPMSWKGVTGRLVVFTSSLDALITACQGTPKPYYKYCLALEKILRSGYGSRSKAGNLYWRWATAVSVIDAGMSIHVVAEPARPLVKTQTLIEEELGNRFAALDSSEHVNKDIQPEEEKLHEIIMKDMEIWESSGQWMFSSYSPMKEKPNISGFSDFLPEELRLVYYNCKANNNTQAYVNSVQQLATQWKGRLNELKNATPSTKSATVTELKNVTNHQSPPFGFGREQMLPPRTSNFPTDTRNTVQAFSFKSSEPAAVSSGNLPNVQVWQAA